MAHEKELFRRAWQGTDAASKQLLSEHSFAAVWTAVCSWIAAQFRKHRGAHLPTFGRLVWRSVPSPHPQTDPVPHIGPAFVLHDAFMAAHQLRPGSGVLRPASLTGSDVLPCEDLCYLRIALKYSSTLTKETVCVCMRRLMEQLGRELRAGPRLQLSMGVGVLRGDGNGAVSFEFLPANHVCKPPAHPNAASATAATDAAEAGAAVTGMPTAGCGRCASPGPAETGTRREVGLAGVGPVEKAGVRGMLVGGGTPRRAHGPGDKGRPASASRPHSAAHKEQPQPQQQGQGQGQRGPSRPASPGPGPRPAWGQRQPPPSPGRHAGTAAPAFGVGSGITQQQQTTRGATAPGSPPRRASCPGSPASPAHSHPYYIAAPQHHHRHQDHSTHLHHQQLRTRCASSPGLPERPTLQPHPTDLHHPPSTATRAPEAPGSARRGQPSPGRTACLRGTPAALGHADPLPDHEVEEGTMMPSAVTVELLHRPGRPTSPCAPSRPLSPGPLSGRGGGSGGLVARPAWGSGAGSVRRQSLGAVCAVPGAGAVAGGVTGRRGGDAGAGVGVGCGSRTRAGTWRGRAGGEKPGRAAGRQQEGILWAVRTAPQETDHGRRRQLGQQQQWQERPHGHETVCTGKEDLQPVRSSSPQGARKSVRGAPAQGGAARPQQQACGGAMGQRDGVGGGHRAPGDTRSKGQSARMGPICKEELKEVEDDQVWVRDQRRVVSLGLGSPGHHVHNARYGSRAAADAAPHVP